MQNKNKTQALITSLIISLVLLVVLVVATLLFDHYMTAIEFDTVGMIAGHSIGFLLMFLVIYHYLKKDDSDYKDNHNIY